MPFQNFTSRKSLMCIYLSSLDVPDVYSFVLIERNGLLLADHLNLHRGDVLLRPSDHPAIARLARRSLERQRVSGGRDNCYPMRREI